MNMLTGPRAERIASRSRRLALPALLCMALLAGCTGMAPQGAGRADRGRVLEYDLGDRAFSVPALKGADGRPFPMELRASVRLPVGVDRGSHPIVFLLPGYWTTCADAGAQRVVDAAAASAPSPSAAPRTRVSKTRPSTRSSAGSTPTPTSGSDTDAVTAAYKKLGAWPCAKGTPPLPSYRGFDFLARALAAQGDVVVSLSANGANAIDTAAFEGDRARAALLTKHATMWRDFLVHDRGPLAHVLPADLRGRVDLHRVGLVGHSRAGRAVLQYAADAARSGWPRGVTIAAVLAIAPASGYGTPDSTFRNTRMPVGVVVGGCDSVSNPPYSPYFTGASRRNSHAVYQWRFRGANHDFFNTQWSPSSGQVGAYDDAVHDAAHPGRCADAAHPDTWVPQRSEHQQRSLLTRYASAFMAHSLLHDHGQDALLSGRKPAVGVETRVHPGR